MAVAAVGHRLWVRPSSEGTEAVVVTMASRAIQAIVVRLAPWRGSVDLMMIRLGMTGIAEVVLEEEKELQESTDPSAGAQLNDVYARLEEIDAASAPSRAAMILAGLGFDTEMQARPTKSFSGGWRMRRGRRCPS